MQKTRLKRRKKSIKEKLYMLDFDCSSQSNLSQVIKQANSNLKLKELGQKRFRLNKIDLRVFCKKKKKKIHFDSLFSSKY